MSDWGKGLINNAINWGRGAITNYSDWGINQRDSYSGDTIIFGMAEHYSKRITDDGGTIITSTCLTNFINSI